MYFYRNYALICFRQSCITCVKYILKRIYYILYKQYYILDLIHISLGNLVN